LRLEVESLEGRDMPSTLTVPANSTPLAASPPPPLVYISADLSSHGAPVNENAIGGTVESGGASSCLPGGGNIDWSHANHVQTSITRSSGEEIPQ